MTDAPQHLGQGLRDIDTAYARYRRDLCFEAKLSVLSTELAVACDRLA